MLGLPLIVAVPSAVAGVALAVAPTFPPPPLPTPSIGMTNVNASVQLLNGSTAPESSKGVTVTEVDLVPACGTFSVNSNTGDCPTASADPGVITVNTTGAVGTSGACAGVTFTVSTIDAATGQVALTPTTPVDLGVPGNAPNDVCVIGFTVNYVAAPASVISSTASGYTTAAIAHVDATSDLTGGTANGQNGTTPVTIAKAQPSVTTNASPAGVVGGTISDTAHLLPASPAGPPPGGTITFTLFNTAGCTGASVFSAMVPVSGTGDYSSGPFAPSAAGTYQWTAAYSGDANNASFTSGCGAANETSAVTLSPPMIAVTKVASPLTEVEPGGTFSFTLQVNNPSTVTPVTVTSLVDNIYGDVTKLPGNTCVALVGVTLAPGASSATCTFSGTFTGKAGATQTDIVTATGMNNGTTVTATAQAIVTLTPAPPQIALTKVASPLSEVEPGGTFTFTAQVSNPSTLEPVTITKLVDNIYGDLSTRPGSTCGALIGTSLAPGAKSAPCSFTGTFTGKAGASQTDVITVTGTNLGTTVTATAQATVTLTPSSPQIGVTKVASPLSLPAPGGSFKFTVTVSNPSTLEPVTITGLTDNVYGNLATRAGSTCGALIGVTLAPGATSAPCSFTGTFTGTSGATEIDTVTATGTNNGTTVTAIASAKVSLTPAPAVPPAAVVGASTLHRPAGCASSKTLKIDVTGSDIKSVAYTLDGKHLATVTKKNSSGQYAVTLKTDSLSLRQHKLVGLVTYRSGKTRSLHATIERCQPPLVPMFTG